MGWTVRRGQVADAEELVRLRGLMFEAMGTDVSATPWQQPCVEAFQRELAGDDLIALVVDTPTGDGLISCAVASLRQHLPRPSNPTGRIAYVSNVCTDPAWRGQGIARAVVTELVTMLDERGVPVSDLHATPEGLGLYRSLGYGPRAGGLEMSRSAGARIASSPAGDGTVDPVPPAAR